MRPFYEALGFDVSGAAFAALSREFIEAYRAVLHEVTLHPGTLDVLARVGTLVEGQLVVSAMEHRLLGEMLREYGVHAHLLNHHGTADLQAGSKVEVGLAAVRALGVAPHEILLVGDTEHDHEVAEAIGCACALLSLGHQAPERLARTGRPVLHDLAAVVSLVQAAMAARS